MTYKRWMYRPSWEEASLWACGYMEPDRKEWSLTEVGGYGSGVRG